MTGTIQMISILAAEGDGFVAPGPADFELPGIFHIGSVAVTKPMVQLLLAAAIVFFFFWAAARKRAMVPGRLQFAGESAYGMVRNSIARDIIGSHDYMKFVPYLFALFFFILVNNVFASVPFIQFPTFSRAGMVYGLAGMSWVVYNVVGIRKHGVVGYLKLQTVPSGVSPFMYPLLVPLEFFSNILVRPVTLALRLFANMLAGHITLKVFAGFVTSLTALGFVGVTGSILPLAMTVAITALEFLVAFLQAYVFTVLTCMYLNDAIHPGH